MDTFSLNCGFCKKSYDEVRLPRNLGCGHSVCTVCVNDCLRNQRFCPECRERHYVTGPNDAPINYPLARFIRSHPCGQIKLPHKILLPSVKGVAGDNLVEGIGMCPGHGSVITSLCTSCSMWVCMDCLVIDHRSSPRGSCKIVGVRDGIKLIKQGHQRRSDALLGKVKSLKRKLEEEEDSWRKYCHLEKNRYHRRLAVRINIKLKDLKNKDESVAKLFVDQLDQLAGVVDKTNSAVELATSCKELLKCQADLEKYMNKEDERKEPVREDLLLHLRVDLQHMTREVKKPLYVSFHEGGKSRWAPLMPRNKGLLINSLRDGMPPNDGIVLPFPCVWDIVYQDGPMVFLEVANAGQPMGVAYVQLFSDSNVCDQTMELFLGKNGQCYKNTKFFHACSHHGVLRGGDFINNNGTGTACRGVGKFGENKYNKRRFRKVSGLLEVHRNFKCRLYFNLKLTTNPINCPVGVVVQGLDVLEAASRLKPFEESSISECGLFLPLR